MTVRLTVTPGPGRAHVDTLPGAIARAIGVAGAEGEATAKMMAPIDTGYHRNSIGFVMVSDTAGELSAASEYAAYLEFGTRFMEARPHMVPGIEAARTRLAAELRNL